MPPVSSGFFSVSRWLFSFSLGWICICFGDSFLTLFIFSLMFPYSIVCIFLELQMQYWALRAAVVLIISDWTKRKSLREVILPPAVFAGGYFFHVVTFICRHFGAGLCECFQPNDMFARKFWKHIRDLVSHFLDSDVPVSSHFLSKECWFAV